MEFRGEILTCDFPICFYFNLWTNPLCGPLPGLNDEIDEITEIFLTGGRVNNGLDGDAEKR